MNATAKERRYKACFDQITRGLREVFDTGTALAEMKNDKLYEGRFKTFEDFCREAFNMSVNYANRLISAAELKDEIVPIGTNLTNEAQLRELKKVPEDKRIAVLKQVEASGPITAKAIAEKAKSLSEPPAVSVNKISRFDETGVKIPDSVLPLWDKTTAELAPILERISDIRSGIRKIMEACAAGIDVPAWRHASANSVVVDLDSAYREIQSGLPYAVCPYCGGFGFAKCNNCKQRGFIGKYQWTSGQPKELLAIRAKASQK